MPVVGDVRDEPNETFYVALGNASNATIADGLGGATIVDDDPPPSVRISNVRVTETNTGGRRARFVVRLSNASAFPITVRFATANGTARAPSDYYAKAATTLNFSPGTTSRVISVWVRGDRRNERNETFFVNLWRGVNATFADRQGRATIVDND